MTLAELELLARAPLQGGEGGEEAFYGLLRQRLIVRRRGRYEPTTIGLTVLVGECRLEPTLVACPTCRAGRGFACGGSHAPHPSRMRAALAKQQGKNVEELVGLTLRQVINHLTHRFDRRPLWERALESRLARERRSAC